MKLENKTIIVTGATNGLGEAAALAFAHEGAEVIVISRSETRCKATVDRIKQETGNDSIRYYAADLSVQSQVRAVSAKVREDYQQIDVLLNNAGAWFHERQENADGIEMTWTLNHLNYFLLTHELLDLVKAAAKEKGEARIISMSSSAHIRGKIQWDDLEFKSDYGIGFGAYSQSKLANVLFTFGLARRLKDTAVVSNAVHPGVVMTGFTKNKGFISLFNPIFKLLVRNKPKDGAMPGIYLSSSPEGKSINAKYYGPPHVEESVNPIAHDEDAQDRLWQLSEEMCGVTAS